MNNLSVAAALATSPSSAFAELRERPRFWFPLLAIALTSAFVIGWYYSVVDVDWLKEILFGNNPEMQKMPPEQRAQAMAFVGRNTLLFGSMFGVLLGVPIFCLLFALYFLIAANLTKVALGFKHWFALVCWTALPGLISTVAAVVFMLLRDSNQIAPGVLQPLSFNELFFHFPPGARGQTLLEALNIPSILSWVLSIIGVRVFSQRSWAYSTIVALIPVALFYGIWAIIAFR